MGLTEHGGILAKQSRVEYRSHSAWWSIGHTVQCGVLVTQCKMERCINHAQSGGVLVTQSPAKY